MNLYNISSGQRRTFDLTDRSLINVYKCVFSKNQELIAFGGDEDSLYFARFANFTQGGNPTRIITRNDRIYDIDFSYDGTRIIICGNKYISVHDYDTRALIYEYAITSGYCSCEFSDLGGRFGWTDGTTLNVKNNDTSTYQNYTNFTNTLYSIKFLRGDPDPICV